MFKDKFEARFENVGGCVERAQSYLVSEGVDEFVAAICMLALSEALNNIIEHSYQMSGDGDVELQIQVDEDSLLFQVKDRGMAPPENIFSMNDRMPDPFDLPEGGWGLALIDSVMDDIEYCFKDGINQLDLVKRIDPCFAGTGG